MRRNNVKKKIFSNSAQRSMFGLVLLFLLSVLTVGVTIAFFSDSEYASKYQQMSGVVEIEAVGDDLGEVSIEDTYTYDGDGNVTGHNQNLITSITLGDRIIPNMPLDIIANCKVKKSTTNPLLRAKFNLKLSKKVEILNNGIGTGEYEYIDVLPEDDIFNLVNFFNDQFNSIIHESSEGGDHWYLFTDGYYYYKYTNAIATDPKQTQLYEIQFDDAKFSAKDYVVIEFLREGLVFPSFVTSQYSGHRISFEITFEAIQNFVPDKATGEEYFIDGSEINNTIEFSKYIFDDEEEIGALDNTNFNLVIDNEKYSYFVDFSHGQPERTITQVLTTLKDQIWSDLSTKKGANFSQCSIYSTSNAVISDSNSMGWYSDSHLNNFVPNNTIVRKGMTLYTHLATSNVAVSSNSASGKSGASGKVVIPKSATSIASNGFATLSNIQKVYIPSSITTIGANGFKNCSQINMFLFTGDSNLTTISDSSFNGCSSMPSILLPKTLTSIGSTIFGNCDVLYGVNIREGCTTYTTVGNCILKGTEVVTGSIVPTIPTSTVKSISNNAFYDFTTLQDIIIPSNIETIGENAFWNCDSLRNIYFPDGTKTIGRMAVAMCDNLLSVEISKSVTSIGDMAFKSNRSLSKMTVETGNTVYMSMGECIIKISDKSVISGCRASIIPTDSAIVTKIGTSAFIELNTIITMHIPSNITEIGTSAFSSCPNLTSVYLYNTTTIIGASCFSSCHADLKIYTNASDKLTNWYSNITSDATMVYNSSYAHYLQCETSVF